MPKRVVVITGASSGIGAALAEHLGVRGEAVVLVARREPELRAVAARSGPAAHVIVADVSERAQVQRVVSGAIARLGGIDVWVNNAGRGITRVPSALTDDDIEQMMRVNVLTALYGMQEVLPHFRSRHAGHVINVSSLLGRVPYAIQRSAYSASKHFLNALTANFRTEVQQSEPGIQFSLVSPGIVHTEFGLNAMHGGADSRSFPDAQSAADVAAMIAHVIDTRRADVYTRPESQQRIVEYYRSLG
jgi:NADP-dependent 3-hydroxy acid dehydrogenase YdfG